MQRLTLNLCVLTLFVVYGVQAVCPLFQDGKLATMFDEHMNRFQKDYGDCHQKQYRLSVFQANHEKIERHNMNSDNRYHLRHNQFSDLTVEEFQSQYLGLIPSLPLSPSSSSQITPDHRHHQSSSTFLSKMDDAIDWREHHVVTPVKDQGQCGSCFAHSAVGAIESLHAIKTGNLLSLSEQQVVDCSLKEGNHGCQGGRMELVFDYVARVGLEVSDNYPYRAVDQKCRYNESLASIKIDGWTNVAVDSESALQAVVWGQPVSVAIDATALQFYHKGVFDGACGHSLNHGVLVVGYGTDEQHSSDYWIVKNSWGSGWGEDGYFRLLRQTTKTGPGQCGIAMDASYPV